MVQHLLRDELPFFDVIWRVIEPVLKAAPPDAPGVADEPDLLATHLGGHGLAAGQSGDADFLMAEFVMVLSRTLAEVKERGPWSEEVIGEVVARNSLRWPLPGTFLKAAQDSAAEFFGAASQLQVEAADRFHGQEPPPSHELCYLVFHNGSDHFYPDKLPDEVLRLREKVLFWLHRSEGDFCSRGRPRPQGPGPQAERVLRFLCHERNAGKTVSLQDLFSSVWLKKAGRQTQNPVLSLRVEMSKLNTFAGKQFEGEGSDAMVRYRREDCVYMIHAATATECCIVRPISLPA